MENSLRSTQITKICCAGPEAEKIPDVECENLPGIKLAIADRGMEPKQVAHLVSSDGVKVSQSVGDAIAGIEVEAESGIEPYAWRRPDFVLLGIVCN